MLRKFQVTNYKNFKDTLTVDFGKVSGYQFNPECITNQLISKMIIFGRNSTGKTNLGYAICDISQLLYTRPAFRRSNEFFLNADSDETSAEFVYTFQFDQDEVLYKYRKFGDCTLLDEELFLNGTRIFYCNFSSLQMDFSNLIQVGTETINIDRYMEALSPLDAEDGDSVKTLAFLCWLTSNSALPQDSVLLKLYSYVRRMRIASTNSPLGIYSGVSKNFYDSLADKDALNDFEHFLNVMGVECSLVCKKLPEGENKLYFKHNTLIPFVETASRGTLALTTLYRQIQVMKFASFLYLDEFDAFYHYEMAENVVRYIKHTCPMCQIIFTTHNTNLMSNQLLRPDCVSILSRAGYLTPLCDATPRELREGHNLEKMYISGEFEQYE